MALDVVGKFLGALRAAFGLDPDPGMPPDILHLGLYPSRVDACAADGSTCDVTPADSRISARKNVRVRAGVPGTVAVVQQGAIVCLAFEGGDPEQPFIDPAWVQGASVQQLVFNAVAVYLAGKTGADALVTVQDLAVFLKAWQSAAVGGNDGGATMRLNTIAALTAASPAGPGWTIAAALGTQFGSSKVKAQR